MRPPVLLLAMLMLIACGAPARPPGPPSNRAAAEPEPTQLLTPLVLPELGPCGPPHHITISLDGVVRAALAVPCDEPRKPNARGVIVITTDASPTFTAPAVAVPPGTHRIVARDAETGLSNELVARFPSYGDSGDAKDRGAAVDTIVVLVHIDWIRVSIAPRASLVLF